MTLLLAKLTPFIVRTGHLVHGRGAHPKSELPDPYLDPVTPSHLPKIRKKGYGRDPLIDQSVCAASMLGSTVHRPTDQSAELRSSLRSLCSCACPKMALGDCIVMVPPAAAMSFRDLPPQVPRSNLLIRCVADPHHTPSAPISWVEIPVEDHWIALGPPL
jgi:hypothetical protein